MYLSFRGPPHPYPASGEIYAVTIHGGIIYATYWQSYVATPNAILVCFVLIGLNILLRWTYMPSHHF